jgi:hypothetical protein
MAALAQILLSCLRDFFRSRAALQSEVMVLRHQLNVLRRRSPQRVQLRWFDLVLFLFFYRLFPSLLGAIAEYSIEADACGGFCMLFGWKDAGDEPAH